MVLLANLVASVSSDETMEEDGTREKEDNIAMHSSKVEPCFYIEKHQSGCA